MNILVTSRELDIAGYDMLSRIAEESNINVYITISHNDERVLVKGNCIPVFSPQINSKFSIKAIKSLRRIIDKYKIDIVFSPSSAALSNAFIASIGKNVKNVGYRGTQARVRKTDPTYYLGILNPMLSHIVCETNDIRDYLSQFIPAKKLSVITKPFDLKWVEQAMLHPLQIDNLSQGAKTCVYIARCKNRPYKGLTLLIEAINILNNKNIHLIFIGDYDEADYEMAQRSEMRNNIHFVGLKDNAIYYLPLQTMFVLPSLRDASPRVLREAMACGLPCVVSNIPGARDLIVDEETGLLFDSNSANSLACKINKLLNNEVLCKSMGEAGKKRIADVYGVNVYTDKFKNLFMSM